MGKVVEQKTELKNKWEKIFDKKMEDVFTEEGIKKYWNDKTSVEEAGEMLDGACVHLAVEALHGDFIGALIMCGEAFAEACTESEEEKPKKERIYRVVGKPDRYIYDDEFKSKQDAKEFIKQELEKTTLKKKDFMIVRVCD